VVVVIPVLRKALWDFKEIVFLLGRVDIAVFYNVGFCNLTWTSHGPKAIIIEGAKMRGRGIVR
jgi:hypothetical protein